MSKLSDKLGKIRRILAGLRKNPRGGTIWLMFRVMKSVVGLTKHGRVNFYPHDQLPWIQELESNWGTIRMELDTVLLNLREVPNAQDEYQGQDELTQDDKWKTYTLVRNGKKSEIAMRQCPETLKLLGRIPQLSTAMFSILAGKKHLKAHCGPYAGLLNCHLGLLVPPNRACRIRVGNEIGSWEEGRLMAFDESHEHEVWNDSDSIRVVMLMYVVRPLPFPLNALNRLVISAGMLLARKLQSPNATPG